MNRVGTAAIPLMLAWLSLLGHPGSASATQVDLTPPLKPAAKALPSPSKAPPSTPSPAKATPSAERIGLEEIHDRLRDLHRQVEACDIALRPVLAAETMPELNADVCVGKSVDRIRALADTAAKAVEKCPAVVAFETLRTEIDLAIEDLERKRDSTSTAQAKQIYSRKIEALRDDPSIVLFDADKAKIKELQNGIAAKITTIREVVEACQEVAPTRSEQPDTPDLAAVVAAAKAEGALNVVALPPEWCGFGALMKGFRDKYGRAINELDPDADSQQQLDLIRAAEGSGAPDVIDVSVFHGQLAKKARLVRPYKVATWDSIPAAAKDPDGYWYGDYFGVITFEVNTERISTAPSDWPDLLLPTYRDAIALAGHPQRTNEAMIAVFAAGLAMSNGNVSGAGEAGLQFFSDLRRAGNFAETAGDASTLAEGTTPIVVRWDYLALADRDRLAGNAPVKVVVPRTGVVANAYVQAISVRAPHPNAAELWMEHLYSDEGQLAFLNAYCNPIRIQDLAARGKIPKDLARRLPPPAAYAAAIFPDPVALGFERSAIFDGWRKLVGAGIN